MPYIKIPPLNEKLLSPDGSMSKVWHRYFDLMQYNANVTADADVTGKWQLRQKVKLLFTASNGTLTRNDFGKTVVFDTQGGDFNCYLPSVDSGDLHASYQIMRLGEGRLVIKAADQDVIETSRPGGVVYCNERARVVANIGLYLAAEEKWGIINGTGIWKVLE